MFQRLWVHPSPDVGLVSFRVNHRTQTMSYSSLLSCFISSFDIVSINRNQCIKIQLDAGKGPIEKIDKPNSFNRVKLHLRQL
jgi:hypothetical protein